jgi:serine protease AprX
METTVCPFCQHPTASEKLAEVNWLSAEMLTDLAEHHPGWRSADGACPGCVQEALLQTLLAQGEATLHERIQQAWPLDAEAAFGAIPTPLRLHADPRFTGRGVTIAMVDVGFYPHPDLTQPANRVRAWVDASDPTGPHALYFGPDDLPAWPGWDSLHARQWHGTMTATAAAGNGYRSRGLYRGLASDADVVLVQVRNDQEGITDEAIVRALRWLAKNAASLGLRVVNISLGGAPSTLLRHNPIDEAVANLVAQNVVVTVAAGNDGIRTLNPPATAPAALTVGGLDDHNTFSDEEISLWHGNYGSGDGGIPKPELVAPSIWVVAPVLPGSSVELEAVSLFTRRHPSLPEVDARIAAEKLITPYYQHVDGTSFAAPLVASTVACMLEANPRLTPALVREILLRTAHAIPGVPGEQQGAGALEAGLAVSMALREQHEVLAACTSLPYITHERIEFVLHEHQAQGVRVSGSWHGWDGPGLSLIPAEPGVWRGEIPRLPPGEYTYKFLVDGSRWLDDPANPNKRWDGGAGFKSVLFVPLLRRQTSPV